MSVDPQQSGGRVSFRDLPKTYEALCALYLPRPIRSRSARTEALSYIEALAGYDLNRDQEDYLEALTLFVYEYEQQFVLTLFFHKYEQQFVLSTPDRMIAELGQLVTDSDSLPGIELDTEAQAAYVRFREGKVARTKRVQTETVVVTMDLDENDNILGLELSLNNPDFEKVMEAARDGVKRYRNTLRALAELSIKARGGKRK